MEKIRSPLIGVKVKEKVSPEILKKLEDEATCLLGQFVCVEWRGGRLLFYVFDWRDLKDLKERIKGLVEEHGFHVEKVYLRWW